MKIRDVALESSINAVGFVALDGTISYINDSWLKMWGYEHKKEVLGIDSLSFWLEKDKVLNVTQELHNKGSWVGELVGVKKNGSTFDVQLSGHMVKNNEGKPIIMMATFLDITERKQAEAELKNHRFHLEKMVNERTNELKTANEQLQKQAQIIDQIHDSVISTDMDGYVTSWNKGAERLFGYSEKEALGKHISFVYTEDEREFLKQMVIVPLKEKGFHEVEVRMQKKTGEYFYAQLSLSVIKDSSGILTGMIGYSMDITERKKNAEELQKMEKLEAVGVLAGGIAHDFNNLLTAILGNLSLAELHVRQNDKSYEYLMKVKNASLYAGKLTQQLLTFSKGGAPVKETASVSELIEETATFALRGSKLKCEYSIPDNLWLLEIDKGQISQVIHNLIINADHAMPNGGIIRIDVKNVTIGKHDILPLEEGKYLKISVKDKGVGIPKDYLSKVFDPYFTTKENGSGLGLATCFSIIKKHRGNITVESEQGNGTTFHVYLPASEKELFEVKEIKEERSYLGHGKILFMDDEEEVINTAIEMLTQLGYKVVAAKNGTEAIELYKKANETGDPFEAVILDLTIAGDMGGKEAVKRLHEIDPNIKAIVSSGYSNNPIMAEYKQYCFSGVVAKPYEIQGLSEVLYKVLNGKERPPGCQSDCHLK